jgi:hypothetical protein
VDKQSRKTSSSTTTAQLAEDNKVDIKPKINQKMPNIQSEEVKELVSVLTKITTNPPNIPLPQYAGRSDNRSFHSFIREFNRVATAMEWDENRMVTILPAVVGNEVYAIYERLDDETKKDWRKLTTTLAQKLAAGKIKGNERRKAISLKRKPNQSVPEFAKELEELIGPAFPDSQQFTKEQREDIIIDSFINGLAPKLKARMSRGTRPATIQDAINAVMEEEELQRELELDAETAINAVSMGEMRNQKNFPNLYF